MNTVLHCAAATLQYGAAPHAPAALCGVNLHIARGERVAIVGANGCGKSSLLRLLHGLLQPTQGTVMRAPGLRQAMVFQRPYVLRMSVQNNIALALWLRGQRWSAARQQALAALERVELLTHAQRPAQQLSAGQQQRVALARAWASAPQLWLLDEPTSSLDPHAKRAVEALVQSFAHQDPDATLVFASHNLGQVKRLASRVLYLENGRLLADAPVAEFFQDALLRQRAPQAYAFVKGERV